MSDLVSTTLELFGVSGKEAEIHELLKSLSDQHEATFSLSEVSDDLVAADELVNGVKLYDEDSPIELSVTLCPALMALGVSFVFTRSGSFEFLGEVVMFIPGLGLYTAPRDDAQNALVAVDLIADVIAFDPPTAELRARVERAIGFPWRRHFKALREDAKLSAVR